MPFSGPPEISRVLRLTGRLVVILVGLTVTPCAFAADAARCSRSLVVAGPLGELGEVVCGRAPNSGEGTRVAVVGGSCGDVSLGDNGALIGTAKAPCLIRVALVTGDDDTRVGDEFKIAVESFSRRLLPRLPGAASVSAGSEYTIPVGLFSVSRGKASPVDGFFVECRSVGLPNGRDATCADMGVVAKDGGLSVRFRDEDAGVNLVRVTVGVGDASVDAEIAVNVRLKMPPPVAWLTTPAGDYVVNMSDERALVILGRCSLPSLVRVSSGDVRLADVECGPSLNWSASVDVSAIQDGPFAFDVESEVGGVPGIRISRLVTKDATPPSFMVVGEPRSVSLADVSSRLISGSCADDGDGAVVTVGDAARREVSTTIACDHASWSVDIDLSPLADGVLSVAVRSSDPAGNSAYVAAEMEKDTEPPEVEVGSAYVARKTFRRTAATAGAATLSWSRFSGPGDVVFSEPDSATTDIEASIDGEYVIRLTAVDSAGNSSHSDFSLSWDTVAPTANAGEDVAKGTPFTRTASVEGAAIYLWSTLSGPGTVSFSPVDSSTTTISATTDGDYVLRLTASDVAGNWTHSDFALSWDSVPPDVSVELLSANGGSPSVTYYPSVKVLLSLPGVNNPEKTKTCVVLAGGQVPPFSDPCWVIGDAGLDRVLTPAQAGTVTASAWAADEVGNISSVASASILYSPLPVDYGGLVSLDSVGIGGGHLFARWVKPSGAGFENGRLYLRVYGGVYDFSSPEASFTGYSGVASDGSGLRSIVIGGLDDGVTYCAVLRLDDGGVPEDNLIERCGMTMPRPVATASDVLDRKASFFDDLSAFHAHVPATMAAGEITTVIGRRDRVATEEEPFSSAINTRRIVAPHRVRFDQDGNLYVVEKLRHRIWKIDSQWRISAWAGNGVAGGPSNGSAVSASLRFPSDVAFDAAGNGYVADSGNHAIRRVTPGGTISTWAGSISGVSGATNATGTAARFNDPVSLAFVGGSWPLYVADRANSLVRAASSTAVVTTFAGTGSSREPTTGGGDGLVATRAIPYPVALSSSVGDLWVLDGCGQVLRVSAGMVTRRAGAMGCGSVDAASGVDRLSASFRNATALEISSSGDSAWIADEGSRKIYRVPLTGGNVVVVAGNGEFGYSGDGRTATASRLASPEGLALSPSGTSLFIADSEARIVRELDLQSGRLYDAAGDLARGPSDAGLASVETRLLGPSGLDVATAGAAAGTGWESILVSDTRNNVVRRFPYASAPSIAMGSGEGLGSRPSDGPGMSTTTSVASPRGVAVDSVGGGFYVAEEGRCVVRRVTAGGTTSVEAGSYRRNGDCLPQAGEGTATFVRLGRMDDIVFQASFKRFFFSEVGGFSMLRRLAASSVPFSLTRAAGESGGLSGYSPADSSSTTPLSSPSGIWIEGSGRVLFADSLNHAIRAYSQVSGKVTTIAGGNGAGFSGDGGAATAAALYLPEGVASDTAGRIYVADSGNNRVRVIGLDGVIRTIAGAGGRGFAGDGGPGPAALLDRPTRIRVDANGDLLILDKGNGRVRLLKRADW